MNILSRYRYTLFFLLGIISWLLVLGFNIISTVANFHPANNVKVEFPEFWVAGIYALFLAANLFLVRTGVGRIEKWDVIDLLWKLLVVGISGIAITFLFQILNFYLQDRAIGKIIHPVVDSVKLYAFVIFSGSAVFIYRKLIFYQKTKTKILLWRTFEGLLLVGFLMLFYPASQSKEPSVPSLLLGYLRSGLVPAFFILSLVISANVNWSAYLNFNQKLKSLFLLFVISLLFVAYLLAFPEGLFDLDSGRGLLDLLLKSEMVLAMVFFFPLIYTIFSALVLIFNLPTSSVFEQRSSEIASFQRINQSIQANLDLNEILNTLLDASLLTSNSSAGWVEAARKKEGGGHEFDRIHAKHVSKEEVDEIRDRLNISQEVLKGLDAYQVQNFKKEKSLKGLKSKFRSLVAIPIVSRDNAIGVVYLLQELTASYEDDTISSLKAFAEQAAIAYENTQLMRQSIEFERFREQIRIAKQVQEQILPKKLPASPKVEFFAVTQDAEEIGGDFYDVLEYAPGKFRVAIGDVSGKGTEAAFYMAETKGIFQALARQELPVRDFIIKSNGALHHCLQEDAFMTLTYLQVDTETQTLEMMRAGHVPALFYHAQNDQLTYHEKGTMGLGIIGNPVYANYVGEPEILSFQKGDILLLYTDGIVEAFSAEKEEFGYDRLKEGVYRSRKESSQTIAKNLLDQVKSFTGGVLDDDYTILVIRFL
ncbi:MAG: SpoIIE family protein phosphatase [Bacteroidia bacterium]|nr:SpoIIE family protein phosphatase [Bacteroidia bacterium]